MSGAKSSTSSPSANSRPTRSPRWRARARPATSSTSATAGKELKVQNIEHFDFAGWDIALFAAGSDVSSVHAPRAAAAGCTVIDNSSLYRMDPDVPLIVPEVNPEAIDGYRAKNIIANPNCSTAQMVVALKPLHDAARIKRVVVATYQSVSGAGKAGMDELFEQSRNIFVGDSNEPGKFTKQIAFNVIPAHRRLPRRRLDQGRMEDGGRDQEDPRSRRSRSPRPASACRCSSAIREAINIEFEDEISAEQAQEILREAPGVMLVDKREDGGYVTPVECVGDYATFVSRVREDPTVDNGLSIWVRQRQPAQGRRAQRGPDRRAARPPPLAEGGMKCSLPCGTTGRE